MCFETLFILLWMFILVHASIQFWLVRDLIKKHLTATALEFRQDLKVSIVAFYRNHKSVTLNDLDLYKDTAASYLESLRVDLNVADAALLCKAGNLTKFSRETAKSVVETWIIYKSSSLCTRRPSTAIQRVSGSAAVTIIQRSRICIKFQAVLVTLLQIFKLPKTSS